MKSMHKRIYATVTLVVAFCILGGGVQDLAA